ncbi:threonyl-tRNA synthetase, partial [Massospora cicadina]
VTPTPEFFNHRISLFEALKAKADAAAKAQPRNPISITLPDAKVKEGISWVTTPMDIAIGISKSLSEKVIIAKVDGELFDLLRPLEASCSLELLTFDDDEGKQVFWHSSAHILGEACERNFGCHLCIGPPLEDGFYYEMSMGERAVSQADYPNLEALAKGIIKEKQPFERLVVAKEELLEMFKHNPFKQHIIRDKIPDGTSTTVYRCGPLIDLCRGPHVPHTGKVKAFAITKNSSSYFLGDANNGSLQRIYGISFPDTKQMAEYKHFLEEAAKRDHRKIGKAQELFFFHELSPGSCFFLPHGARIYNTLIDYTRSEYRKRGFQEVVTPNIYDIKLWETSGHWENYKENMFAFEVENSTFALKPMNCPGHCLMFGHRDRSYRELPLRLADFGVLHRNEFSGALTGLTRVRRFQQDDAHIFCTSDQVEQEIKGCFAFLEAVYGVFGFTFELNLSTRPANFIGEVSVWDKAEAQLESALNEFGFPWKLNPGDGAFYGPKVDIKISDALRRKHQCATIQLDFQLPERFKLEFRSADNAAETAPDQSGCQAGYQRPIIIHRAIYGSVERMIGILTENFGGKWPLWLSPRQVLVIPVTGVFDAYAGRVRQALQDAGFYADADVGETTLNKKIRNGELAQYNFIAVVGGEEEASNSVNLRNRDDAGSKSKGAMMPLGSLILKLAALRDSRSITNALPA